MNALARRGLVVAIVAALAGCAERQRDPNEAVAPNTSSSVAECTACHGGSNPAPPRDASGQSSTSLVGVGAHQSHLSPARARVVQCAECHVVPPTTNAAGHRNGQAEVVFGALARADGAQPAWNATATTCTTYCHGATLTGGQAVSPVWTRVDDSQRACTSCHGFPPSSAAHAGAPTDCARCHGAVVSAAAQGVTIIRPDLHVDGLVQGMDAGAPTQSCNSCHGGPSNAAPPRDTTGKTATTAIGVGAHQVHLGATLSSPVACSECHAVPATVNEPGHILGAPARVTLGPRSRADGVSSPAWNRAGVTCTTYCHGASLAGGTATRPVWTRVDGSQKTCSSCHGYPPPAPHPASNQCSNCHGQTVSATGALTAARHIDGQVQVTAAACGSCHSIPPRTGRHPVVFGDHRNFGCTTCHGNVANSAGNTITNAQLHNNGSVQVQFSGGGSYNSSTKTCTNSCHREGERWSGG